MIKVYFESKYHAEEVATFTDEEVYIAGLPSLKKYAKKHGMIVTETVEESIDMVYDIENVQTPIMNY
jgi:hypothetical protein